MIDNVDFVNSVQIILQQFITTKMREIFNEDVYVVFNLDDVKMILQDGRVEKRPVFHLWRETPSNSHSKALDDTTEVQDVFMSYTAFSVVDSEVTGGEKPDIFLNRMTSRLKYIFDNFNDELDEMHNFKIGYCDGNLTRTAENIHSHNQKLEFRIRKKVL